jgi:tetratricopeptide (TPR) repeat protein
MIILNAIEDLNQTEALDKNYEDLYCKRGLLYLKIKQPEKACKDFGNAVINEPQRAVALLKKNCK